MRSLRESLGISADGSERAFSAKDIESLMDREPPPIVYSARDPTLNTQHVFLAVDPSGGGASAFSIASIVQAPNGFLHVRRPRPSPLSLPGRRRRPGQPEPEPEALAGPQLAQRGHERHERVGPLAHADHKRGNGQGRGSARSATSGASSARANRARSAGSLCSA